MKKVNLSKISLWIISALIFVLYIFPFLMIIVNSFKERLEVVADPISIPKVFSLENYKSAFETMNFGTSFINSLLVTTVSVIVIVFFSSTLAYFLVRWKWKINGIILMLMIASMIIPFQSIMIPFVSIFGEFGLLNSREMLIFYYLGFGISMATFMYHGFIKNIPVELEEAAIIDGASKFTVFFKVVFPLLKPTTTTIAILDVLWIWNDFLLPSLVLVKDDIRTLPLSTFYFFGKYTADYNIAMAALVLCIIPILIFYFIMQKQIIQGVMDGGIK
ncbi:binding-protein-dependent transport systems inner membrane component [Neobacillus bataviensis LMG 21833]|uniref:Binding-protein-dependent transport systems inner membrane component n=1 Tax=Neobacillus bataviensis LMG 21833 TaxID=1117379 RepID=K6DN33_9BACI|nr:carbohydrate ABC transporter permease [Neobacillus bataviensis]EKN69744.1 binding-protein-dependent transport systems inner membrane component [Neobacillus bataviensis LMG 21833]